MNVSTPNLADACLRLGMPVRCAPITIRPLVVGTPISGRVLPVKHHGSVDVFLEAFERAAAGDVLVIDNENRADEACIGDLVAIEAKGAGLSGIVIWGLHRDSQDIRDIGLPVYSTGAHPSGPRRLDTRVPSSLERARVGEEVVTRNDYVFADDDGVLFVAADRVDEVIRCASSSSLQATSKRAKATPG